MIFSSFGDYGDEFTTIEASKKANVKDIATGADAPGTIRQLPDPTQALVPTAYLPGRGSAASSGGAPSGVVTASDGPMGPEIQLGEEAIAKAPPMLIAGVVGYFVGGLKGAAAGAGLAYWLGKK